METKANQIIKDILKFPNAKYLALVAQKALQGEHDKEFSSVSKWLLTGNYQSTDRTNWYLTIQDNIPSLLVFHVLDNDPNKAKIMDADLIKLFSSTPQKDIELIGQKSKLLNAIGNIQSNLGVPMNEEVESLRYIANFLTTGKNDNPAWMIWIYALFIMRPNELVGDILGKLSDVNYDYVTHEIEVTLEELGKSIGNMPQEEKLARGLKMLSELNQNIQANISMIYNYFYPAPEAPEPPVVMSAYRK